MSKHAPALSARVLSAIAGVLSGGEAMACEETLSEVLATDTTCEVVVTDEDPKVLSCNRRYAKRFAKTPKDMVGASLLQLLPEQVARERSAIVKSAISTGKAHSMVGMVNGVWTTTTVRPVETGGAQRAALIIETPSRAEDDSLRSDMPRMHASFHDLGSLDTLTDRELEMLRLIGQGFSTAEIAKLLHRSPKTVEGHRTSLRAALGVQNRVDVAKISVRSGLTELSDEEFAAVLQSRRRR